MMFREKIKVLAKLAELGIEERFMDQTLGKLLH
jgi:hypothetical protein